MSEKYLVSTDAGEFTIIFRDEIDDDDDDDDDKNDIIEPVFNIYEGDTVAIHYFRNYLLFNFVSGEHGHSIDPDRVSPYDFWAFCQTDTIRIIPTENQQITFQMWEEELEQLEDDGDIEAQLGEDDSEDLNIALFDDIDIKTGKRLYEFEDDVGQEGHEIDKQFIQSVVDGKLDFYDKSVIDRLIEISEKYPTGEINDLLTKAKQAAKDFLVKEFNKKVGNL